MVEEGSCGSGDEVAAEAFVAVVADQLVGVVAFQMREPTIAAIPVLAVTHSHRRRGIGTALKQRVLDTVAPRGVLEVVSEVHRRNTAMNNLNAKLGAVADKDPDDGDLLLTVAVISPGT